MFVFKMRDSDLARDIPPFVMYCMYGESGPSLLIESTDSMIFEHTISANTHAYTQVLVHINAKHP